MKKEEVLLTVMEQRISKFGNIYYEGPHEGGGKIIMRKAKSYHGKHGEKIWKLFFVK